MSDIKTPWEQCNWTKSRYFSFIRSNIRRAWSKYPVKFSVLLAARRDNQSENKRLKYEYNCDLCKGWFPQKEVEVDHLNPCGSLKEYSDLEGFCSRLFCGSDNLRVLCKTCHKLCTNSERVAKAETKSKRVLYPDHWSCWAGMLQRCSNPNSTNYNRYGGRGIKVCSDWVGSVEAFVKDMGDRPSKAYSVERLDVDGDYTPLNCVWATQKQQMRNTSRNSLVEFDSQTKTVAEWAEELGIKANTITYRLRRGWSVPEALEYAPREKQLYNGKLTEEEVNYAIQEIMVGRTQTSVAEDLNIDSSQISRLVKKFTQEERERKKKEKK